MPQFKKGQSGNPKGRPKDFAWLKELARTHTEAAITTLATEMTTAENSRDRSFAADRLLDRAWGKPSQEVDITTGGEKLTVSVIINTKTTK